MTDITDTLIIIQIKAFVNGQRALLNSASDGEPSEWLKGYSAATFNIFQYIDELIGMNIKFDAPWVNTYKEPTK